MRPTIERQTLTTISPYTQADIEHLTLKLFSTSEADLGISKTLLNADLGKSVAFSSLKANTSYRVRAFAYASAGTAQPISNDANSYVDIIVGTDDRPTVTSIPVKLINKDFNGQATGTLQVTNGGYLNAGAENMDFLSPFGVVTTFAGNGTAGATNGTGNSVTFNYPYGIAVDTSDNIFVSDRSGQRIRKITPNGVVTTFAGNGAGVLADGTGTSASFGGPSGLAFDRAGNLYVAENGVNAIRKISPAGIVTTLAGNGTTGSADGIGSCATFNSPYAVAVDQSGNVYVTDTANYRIRKISPTGTVTTLAGCGSAGYSDGVGTNSAFNNPKGITLDVAGNLYIADYDNNRIRKITPTGVVTTVAGNGTAAGTDGTGTNASISHPQGVILDSVGNLYVTDGRVRKITPDGKVTTIAGSIAGMVDSIGTAAQFSNPCGIAIDSHGCLYIADFNNCRVRKVQ